MNPIHEPISILFEKLNLLNFQINYFQKRIERLKKTIQLSVEKNENFEIGNLIHATALPISDLTGPTDNGCLYSYPSGNHSVRGEKYIEQLDWFLQKEASLTVRQGYEVFETYLYDITATYFYQNQNELPTEIFKNNLPSKPTNNLDEFHSAVRGVFKRKANSDLISFLRGFGDDLKKAESEKQNNRKLNLIDWFEVTTQLRHGVTHSLSIIDIEGLKKLSEVQKKLLRKIYPGDYIEDGYKLELTSKSAKSALSRYAEYGFAIFKSLSIEHNFEWEYLLKTKSST